jgi:hypothetical protein
MEILLLPNWLLARLALTPAQRIHLNAFASILVAAAGIILAAFLVSQLIARPVALFAARTEQTVARLSRHGSIITILCLVAVWLSRLIAK